MISSASLKKNVVEFLSSKDLDEKQDILKSGENIKTINGESILGSGNIIIEGSDFDDLFKVTTTTETVTKPELVYDNIKSDWSKAASNTSARMGPFFPTDQTEIQNKVLHSLKINWSKKGVIDVYVINVGGFGILDNTIFPKNLTEQEALLKHLCKLTITKLGNYEIVLTEDSAVSELNPEFLNEQGQVFIPEGHYIGFRGNSQIGNEVAAFTYGGTNIDKGFVYLNESNNYALASISLSIGMSILETKEITTKDYAFDNYLIETNAIEDVEYVTTFDTTNGGTFYPTSNAAGGVYLFSNNQQEAVADKLITGVSYYGNAGKPAKFGYITVSKNNELAIGLTSPDLQKIWNDEKDSKVLFTVIPTKTTTSGEPDFFKLDGTDPRVQIVDTEKYNEELGGFLIDETMALCISDRQNTQSQSATTIGSGVNYSSFFFCSGKASGLGHFNTSTTGNHNNIGTNTETSSLLVQFYTTELTTKEIKTVKSGVLSKLLGDEDENTSLKGKYLSLIGDSISTFQGWSNIAPASTSGAIYYPKNDINSVEQTYWHKLVTRTGMNLLVNNSWSGSTCAKYGSGYVVSKTNDRCAQLAKNGHSPDYIVINIGTNDFNRGLPLGTWNGRGEDFPAETLEPESFREAYAVMLHRLRKNYPLAKIFCCTVPCGDNNGNNLNEKNSQGVYLVEFNDAIREIATAYGVHVIELATSGLDYFTLSTLYGDSRLHPSEAGMERYYEIIRHALENEDSSNVSCPRTSSLMQSTAEIIADSEAENIEDLVSDFNALLAALRARGVIAQ